MSPANRPGKRNESPSPSRDVGQSSSKKARLDKDYVDDDDEFAAVLASIRDAEASEALARQLQEEWDAGQSTSSNGNGAGHGPGPSSSKNGLTNGNGSHAVESDEALARRLAKEWGSEDVDVELLGEGFEHDDDARMNGRSSKRSASTAGLSTNKLTNGKREKRETYENGTLDSSRTPSSSEEDDLAQYRDLFTTVAECSKCKQTLKVPRTPASHPYYASRLPFTSVSL